MNKSIIEFTSFLSSLKRVIFAVVAALLLNFTVVVTAIAATPTVTVVATDNLATEAGLTTGTFTFTRTGSVSAALTVSYTVSGAATIGSDYTSIGAGVKFPAGAITVTKKVTPLQDSLQELSEKVVLTLSQSPNYAVGVASRATVTLVSDESITQTVTVAATDNSATEAGPTTGTFTFTRTGNTGASLTVSYTVGGTATSGSDYKTLGASVNLPAGIASITKTVTPFGDNIQEPNETINLALIQSPNYAVGAAGSAKVIIVNLTLASVALNVNAHDFDKFPLTYEWRATDGSIININSPSTTWTLPAGPGIHFAYVLVSNGMGGYTERRIAVNTDSTGVAAVVPAPANYAPPPAPTPVGNSYRSRLHWGYGKLQMYNPFAITGTMEYQPSVPDVLMYATDPITGATLPPGGPAAAVRTDLRGQFVIPGVKKIDIDPFGYLINCSFDNGTTWSVCSGAALDGDSASTDYGESDIQRALPSFPINGRVIFDSLVSTSCGVDNEFFGVVSTATARVLDISFNALAAPVRLSVESDFSLPQVNNAAFVEIDCENNPPLYIRLPGMTPGVPIQLGLINQLVRDPDISTMTATINGASVGQFLAPPTGLPSDTKPDVNHFLTYKGIDSRRSACEYYKAIGAVKSCDAQGNFSGAINIEDWKRNVKIGAYAVPGTPEYSAIYINQIDLNLTRDHHSISYGPGKTAAYVCNHLGPSSLNPTQLEINTVIDNALASKNKVACVMMDNTATPGVNGDQPFTRFLIFGPSGELLPSVNLDGRGEKFVPGTCVACHGGDKYAGQFPADGSGSANIGTHFLPYDIGNFAFSNKPGLTRTAQEEAIYHLNQNVLKSGPTAAAQALIAGWYPGGVKTQDLNYLPPAWQGMGYDDAYHKVYARYCRTCHVNLLYDFDTYYNAAQSPNASCGFNTTQQHRMQVMPNSLVTFNRFWSTKGTADDLTALWAKFLSRDSLKTFLCELVTYP